MGIDWIQGTWKNSTTASHRSHRIIITGDWAPIREYEKKIIHDPERVYGDLLPTLRDADMRIVNLEASLSLRGAPITKDGPNLLGSPEAITGLTTVPFDLACLANNHTMDYGTEALEDSLKTLQDRSIRTVGAGLSRGEAQAPLVLSLGETRVGIVNFSEGEDGIAAIDGAGVFGWEIGTVVRTVEELRENVDIVIVIVHAGREYTPVPPPYIQDAYRTVIRAGADIVVGHHPHVPQGIEIYEGAPIVYSLGNFVFYQQATSIFQKRGYLLSVELGGRELTGFRLIPYSLGDEGVQQLTAEERTLFYRHLRNASEVLKDSRSTREVWNAFIDSFGESFWRDTCGGIAALTERIENESDFKAAARLRNRFNTPAHHYFLADGFGRLINGTLGSSEDCAQKLVRRWRSPEGLDEEL